MRSQRQHSIKVLVRTAGFNFRSFGVLSFGCESSISLNQLLRPSESFLRVVRGENQ
jgi:hypothetical protein